MGKCNPVHSGKCNLKHRHSKGGRILESSNAEGALRVKLDMNLQYDLTAWPASAVVLYRVRCIWEHEGCPSWHGSDCPGSWVSGHWEGTENQGELRKEERVDWYRLFMGRNAIKTPTQHFPKAQVLSKYLCIGSKAVGGNCSLPSPRAQNCLGVSRKASCCLRLRKSTDLGLGALSWLCTLAGSLQTPVLWEGLAGTHRRCPWQSKGANRSSVVFTDQGEEVLLLSLQRMPSCSQQSPGGCRPYAA